MERSRANGKAEAVLRAEQQICVQNHKLARREQSDLTHKKGKN